MAFGTMKSFILILILPIMAYSMKVDLSNQNPKLTTLVLPSNVSNIVTSLILQSNQLGNSTAIWFKGLTAITSLNMNYNSMTNFPNLTYIGNTLVNLYLRGNAISDIPYTLLNVLVKLKHIDMRENSLTTVPDPVGPSNTIQTAYFHNNQIGTLPIVTNLGSSLYNLHFEANGITTISSGFLAALKNLKVLNLNENKLTTFPDFTPVMSTIQEIHMYGSQISSITLESLDKLKLLRRLNIGGNLLTSFPNTTNPLTHLYLHDCKFTSYPDLTNYGNTLILFHFRGNYIGKAPDPEMFKPLSKLTHLYLGRNNFDIFPNLTYISSTLKLLGLYSNKITSVPADLISILTELTNLDLQWNKLTELDISPLHKLTNIHLRGNPLNSLPNMPQQSAVVKLAYSNIGLTSVDTSQINGLTNLQYLYLHQNKITQFPDIRFAEGSLIQVYLYSNELTNVKPDYVVFPTNKNNLKILLNDNQLKSLPPVIAPEAASVYVNVSGNPLHCDRSLAWVIRLSSKYHLEGKCASPDSVAGVLLKDITNLKMVEAPAVSVVQGRLADNWEADLGDNSSETCTYIIPEASKFPTPCSAIQSKLVLELADPKTLLRSPVAVNVSTMGGSCAASQLLVYTSARDYISPQCNNFISDDVTWTANLCTLVWSEENNVKVTCSYHCDYAQHLFIAIGWYSQINYVCDVSYGNI